MIEDLETVELQETYQQADAEGRKKIVEAAAQLLKAQKSLGAKPDETEKTPPSAQVDTAKEGK